MNEQETNDWQAIPVGSRWVERYTVQPATVVVMSVTPDRVGYGDGTQEHGGWRPWAFRSRYAQLIPVRPAHCSPAPIRTGSLVDMVDSSPPARYEWNGSYWARVETEVQP